MELLIKGSTELNKMFMALQRTATGLRHDFGEVENLQQSLRGARDFVQKAEARIEESILSDLMLVRPNAGLLTPNVSRAGDGADASLYQHSDHRAVRHCRSDQRYDQFCISGADVGHCRRHTALCAG